MRVMILDDGAFNRRNQVECYTVSFFPRLNLGLWVI